jgi:competence protein ComEA
MWEKIRAYLTFTRKERIGVLVLLVIILVLFVFPYFFQAKPGSKDPLAFEKYQDGIRKFQSSEPKNAYKEDRSSEKESPDSYSNTADRFSMQVNNPAGKDSSAGEIEKRPDLFYFDPNRISAADWRRLGLGDRLIQTIEHYLQKGGSFRSASDLKKLYGLKAEDFKRLFPYVRIREPPDDYRQRTMNYKSDRNKIRTNNPEKTQGRMVYYVNSRESKIPHISKYVSGEYTRKNFEDLDINQADSSLWCHLPGIGIKLASRIIHFRDKLGGFYSVDQLSETFGLPDSTFQKIRPFLHSASTELQKINLNSARQETLQEHPYIRWKLARMIIQYREQHGGFKIVSELQQLGQMDPEKFKKLEPYLEVK